jgi:hypothetical protein
LLEGVETAAEYVTAYRDGLHDHVVDALIRMSIGGA